MAQVLRRFVSLQGYAGNPEGLADLLKLEERQLSKAERNLSAYKTAFGLGILAEAAAVYGAVTLPTESHSYLAAFGIATILLAGEIVLTYLGFSRGKRTIERLNAKIMHIKAQPGYRAPFDSQAEEQSRQNTLASMELHPMQLEETVGQ